MNKEEQPMTGEEIKEISEVLSEVMKVHPEPLVENMQAECNAYIHEVFKAMNVYANRKLSENFDRKNLLGNQETERHFKNKIAMQLGFFEYSDKTFRETREYIYELAVEYASQQCMEKDKQIQRLHQELDLRCEHVKIKDRLLEEANKNIEGLQRRISDLECDLQDRKNQANEHLQKLLNGGKP